MLFGSAIRDVPPGPAEWIADSHTVDAKLRVSSARNAAVASHSKAAVPAAARSSATPPVPATREDGCPGVAEILCIHVGDLTAADHERDVLVRAGQRCGDSQNPPGFVAPTVAGHEHEMAVIRVELGAGVAAGRLGTWYAHRSDRGHADQGECAPHCERVSPTSSMIPAAVPPSISAAPAVVHAGTTASPSTLRARTRTSSGMFPAPPTTTRTGPPRGRPIESNAATRSPGEATYANFARLPPSKSNTSRT